MALGRSARADSRRTSSCCSTTTVAVFVALCLVGVWMLTSSTINPLEMSSIAAKSHTKDKNSDDDSRSFKQIVTTNSAEQITKDLVDRTQANMAQGNDNTDINSDANQEAKELEQIEGKYKEKNQNSDVTEDHGRSQVEYEKLKQSKKSEGNKAEDEGDQGSLRYKVEQDEIKKQESSGEGKNISRSKVESGSEVFPSGAQSELLNEANTQNGAWSTQAVESKNEREMQKSLSKGQSSDYSWKLCNVTAGADYIPCLDNEAAIRKLHSTKHYEHRERHCPVDPPTCLVPVPDGYKKPIKWPESREKIWYNNVPHTKLAAIKGHQNWVKVSGEYLTFPGGGTQFKHGALHYIDFIQESLPDIAWGRRSRVVLDVGCGVASFGGFLFERDVITMSFAPKDEHEAQVQFALERGIPAISAVMGTKRLPFPSKVFDVVHCARCRVPWHAEGGMLLLELNRLLRPGGYFVWSATPVYRKVREDVEIWEAMSALTKSMCWKMVAKKNDQLNEVGVAIYKKPFGNKCYEERANNNPPLCQTADDPDAAWNVSLQACLHTLPTDAASRGTLWPELWPLRLEKVPYWFNKSQVGIYGKPAPEDFMADYEHWKRVVSKSYASGLGINWATVRNVMDMRSVYGGFAAALRNLNVWVMNVVSIDAPDTLPVIYERGLFGIYHDWCESFSTYPRTYDLLHADHLFSKLKKRCQLLPVMVEVDRILRPDGKLIVRDKVDVISEIENVIKSLHWEIRLTYSQNKEGLICVQKTMWRPTEVDTSQPAS